MRKLSSRKRAIIGIILNFTIFAITCVAMIWDIWFRGDAGPLGDFAEGAGSLKTFTNESNILCAVVALVLAIVGLKGLKKKDYRQSHTLGLLQLIAATAVLLTFVVVLVFLSPMIGIETGDCFSLYAGEMFITHLVNPILAAIVFVFFTPGKVRFTVVDNFIALIPMALYGVVYLMNVLTFGTWPDFYNFTLGGQVQFVPFVILSIVVVSFGLARILIWGRKKFNRLLESAV